MPLLKLNRKLFRRTRCERLSVGSDQMSESENQGKEMLAFELYSIRCFEKYSNTATSIFL